MNNIKQPLLKLGSKILKYFGVLVVVLITTGTGSAIAKTDKNMKIKILFDGHEIIFELERNPTTNSLLEQLPLKVKVEDYASIEKIFYPPKKLSTKEAPAGYEPKAGDITYYAPWGDVAIFYKDFSFAKGLIHLGKVISGMEHLKKLKDTEVKVEEVK